MLPPFVICCTNISIQINKTEAKMRLVSLFLRREQCHLSQMASRPPYRHLKISAYHTLTSKQRFTSPSGEISHRRYFICRQRQISLAEGEFHCATRRRARLHHGGPRSGGRSPRVQEQRIWLCCGRIWNPPLRYGCNIRIAKAPKASYTS